MLAGEVRRVRYDPVQVAQHFCVAVFPVGHGFSGVFVTCCEESCYCAQACVGRVHECGALILVRSFLGSSRDLGRPLFLVF